MLFIDSLDQLSNYHKERLGLSFLKHLTPHADSRIIVSTLPDKKNPHTNKVTHIKDILSVDADTCDCSGSIFTDVIWS
jgi:hypothetical protein